MVNNYLMILMNPKSLGKSGRERKLNRQKRLDKLKEQGFQTSNCDIKKCKSMGMRINKKQFSYTTDQIV